MKTLASTVALLLLLTASIFAKDKSVANKISKAINTPGFAVAHPSDIDQQNIESLRFISLLAGPALPAENIEQLQNSGTIEALRFAAQPVKYPEFVWGDAKSVSNLNIAVAEKTVHYPEIVWNDARDIDLEATTALLK